LTAPWYWPQNSELYSRVELAVKLRRRKRLANLSRVVGSGTIVKVMNKINLDEKFALFEGHGRPRRSLRL
jgi:hypothetical protein